ncbi:hypothetical protein SK355_08455 [Candidatus Fukatsuia symbiotica]|uniref:LD-carboxypeptidase N-terminal domain-containing protein n=1 Tax=Candidatus Fukatsuia symbiotica TaxID=1878942 RepID=A0A2U8I6W8_9GAMM|nr:hypothetical protein [Candidatus Fukatsuia symbiotica]AWK14921.1 hypothetical protein CCS41_11255 [Candidatus Fukatsuia symbiotica]MEA9445273.1 hypothetical protein [Candidatus Fukatsuia symbiotica]
MISNNPNWPKPLKEGSKIAILSPAGAVKDENYLFLNMAINMIKGKGYIVKLGSNTLDKYNHYYSYAGTYMDKILSECLNQLRYLMKIFLKYWPKKN